MNHIFINGFWNDDPTQLLTGIPCKVGCDFDEDDDSIFFYFEDYNCIIGDHYDFTVTSYEEAI